MFIVVDCGCICVIGFICEYLYIDGLPSMRCHLYTACICKWESYHWINSFIYYLGYYSNTLIFYMNEPQRVLNHQVWPLRLVLMVQNMSNLVDWNEVSVVVLQCSTYTCMWVCWTCRASGIFWCNMFCLCVKCLAAY